MIDNAGDLQDDIDDYDDDGGFDDFERYEQNKMDQFYTSPLEEVDEIVFLR